MLVDQVLQAGFAIGLLFADAPGGRALLTGSCCRRRPRLEACELREGGGVRSELLHRAAWGGSSAAARTNKPPGQLQGASRTLRASLASVTTTDSTGSLGGALELELLNALLTVFFTRQLAQALPAKQGSSKHMPWSKPAEVEGRGNGEGPKRVRRALGGPQIRNM